MLCSINDSLDYSSIDESIFRKFVNHANAIFQISSKMDTRNILPPSRNCSLKDVLSDNKLEAMVLNFSDLNSDFTSLASTFMDSIHMDYSL